jgi:two-component sensor histidine kinase
MLLLIYIIIVAIYLALKRNKQAYFIITGWVIIFVVIIFTYLNSIGVFSIYQYLTYYVEGSFLFEAVIFSIALADKINSLNKKLIKQKQTEKIRLESEVNKKTKELQTKVQEKEDLLKELNHRVKNNIQNIISLIRIQSDEIKNKKTVEQFISIENRLSAMNHLHEILYKKSDISKVNCYQYIESIVDNLQESYEKDYVDIKYEVNTKLEMETKSISSFGLIVNELVTNTFKYAFEDEKGNLLIKLTLKDEIYKLVIKDDGIGCQLSDFETSFGISLVKDLVEEHLVGSIKSKIGNGIEHTIEWRKK